MPTETMAARVTQMISEASEGESSGATEADSSPEAEAGAPPAGQASGAESASVASPPAKTEAGAPAVDDARKTKHQLLQEKLAETRERRQAQRIAERARAEKKQADADRKAAAEERTKWESLKTGNFKEAIAAMGKDPRAVFEEMQEEAKLAGTPEAQMKRMQELFEKQIADVVEPLKKELEATKEEKKQALVREENARFASEFTRAVQDPAYTALRVEYSDEQLFTFARTVKHDLTQAGKRFTILDVLKVLKDAQDEHDAGREARRTRLQAPTESQAAQVASEKPTVNGTAERRNAGTTLGNDLASSRASGDRPRTHTTRAERIKRLIDGAG